MKKFEEELFSEVPCKFGLNTEGEYKQSILIKHFGDWISPEDHQAEVDQRKQQYEEHQEIYSKTAKKLNEAELELSKLKSQLEKQQPEIPEFVAEGIKSIPDHYTAFGAMLLVKEKIEITKGGDINSDWLPLYNWLFSNNEINSQDLFSQAWFTGYTVAKEKRFYLKNKLTGFYLYKAFGGKYGEESDRYGNKDFGEDFQFTQSQIDSMETGSYEQIEVEE